MIARRPHSSLLMKFTSSCWSKSGKPQGVVIVVQTSDVEKMGRPRGLEPPTPGTTNQCSNQLSYDRHGAFGSGSLARAGHLGLEHREGKRGIGEMNPTIEKFGYPATLLHELQHWLILLRPAQLTL